MTNETLKQNASLIQLVYDATRNTKEARGQTAQERKMYEKGANWHPLYLAARELLLPALEQPVQVCSSK